MDEEDLCLFAVQQVIDMPVQFLLSGNVAGQVVGLNLVVESRLDAVWFLGVGTAGVAQQAVSQRTAPFLTVSGANIQVFSGWQVDLLALPVAPKSKLTGRGQGDAQQVDAAVHLFSRCMISGNGDKVVLWSVWIMIYHQGTCWRPVFRGTILPDCTLT